MHPAFQAPAPLLQTPLQQTAPFICHQIANGRTLFVGEGNMSFACSVLSHRPTVAQDFVVTTYETEDMLDETARENKEKLEESRIRVIHGVDAIQLEKPLPAEKFDTIIFQFPNVGSREPIAGQNPNAVLIDDFLRCARNCLAPNGKVIITHVDSSYYRGLFQIEDTVKKNHFIVTMTKEFNPGDYPGYAHTNTLDDDSAIKDYDKFITWVLQQEVIQ